MNKRFTLALCLLSFPCAAQTLPPHTFAPNTPALASEVNENFSALATAIAENEEALAMLTKSWTVVDNITDLRTAIDTAGGNSVNILLADGVYEVDAAIGVFGNVWVRSAWGDATITRAAGYSGPIFTVTGSVSNISLSDVVVWGNGAIECQGAAVYLTDSTLVSNSDGLPFIQADGCLISLTNATITRPFPFTTVVDITNGSDLIGSRAIVRGDVVVTDGGVDLTASEVPGAIHADFDSYVRSAHGKVGTLDIAGNTTALVAYNQLDSVTVTPNANGTPTMRCIGNYSPTATPVGC